MNYLPLEVYRAADGHDCSAKGISSKYDTIYVACEDGAVHESKIPPCLRFESEDRGGDYWAVIPGMLGSVRPMFGGNLATTSDSRAHSRVYHIHDRYEG